MHGPASMVRWTSVFSNDCLPCTATAECLRYVEIHVQCRHLIPALNAWAVRAYYTNESPIDTQFHTYGCMDFLKIKHSSHKQVTLRSLMCLDHFFDMLSVGFCTTRHCQTTSQLVQELNVCTVLPVAQVYSAFSPAIPPCTILMKYFRLEHDWQNI